MTNASSTKAPRPGRRDIMYAVGKASTAVIHVALNASESVSTDIWRKISLLTKAV